MGRSRKVGVACWRSLPPERSRQRCWWQRRGSDHRGSRPGGGADYTSGGSGGSSDPIDALVAEGKQTFRFDTFGDQAFWGDTLHLNQAIAGAANGGVGPGVSPKTALSVGPEGRRGRAAGRGPDGDRSPAR